ncbi:MAG: glycosyl hydrolase [bacterium]|nr:glycosyl hydrolase [bacterium]
MTRRCLALSLVCIAFTAGAAEVPEELLNSLSYRLVGPHRGGRVTTVAGVVGDPLTYYMGTTGGGVWKTNDAGISWFNVSDMERELEPKSEPEIMGDVDPMLAEYGLLRPPVGGLPEIKRERRGGDAFGVGSIGAVAVAPSDPNIIYVGTGSACIRGNVSPGDGVYRSTDAGNTWRHIGLDESGQIGRIVVHPTDPDLVYVAALGHAFGPNPERGVFRSTDGGISWSKVLFVSDEAGAVDLAMNIANPRILYAAFWQAVRKPWTMISGGEGSGLYKSEDGGNTWIELTEGLPNEGPMGRIGVAVSPAAPNRVWALIEHDEGGIYRSDNGGESFRRINQNRELRQRAWYYTHLEADPQDANTLYMLGVAFWRSVDGGKSFRPIRTPHGDNHAMWINPNDPQNMIEGNDGGANISFNGGRTWSTQTNQPTAEVYRLTVDDQQPYWLYGGQQDNSAIAIPSRTADGGIARQHWYAPAGCESATVAIDPRNPKITYGGCYGGSIGRYDHELGHQQQIMAWPQMAVGQKAEDLRYRFQWNAPIRLSPHDPKILYHCSNHVHRSTDEGQTWTVISPDLSRNDVEKQDYAGGDITWDNTGVEVYGTIFAFEESQHQEGLLWAGTDDGRVHISTDNGANWSEITPDDLPEWGTVNTIELSEHDPGRAFLAVQRYRMDDFTPYIFRTDDFGESWSRITNGTNGIPADHFVRVVREDPKRKGMLYAGTEFGMYVSFDDGAQWQSLQLNLPVTPITDLRVKRGDLAVATQGRSFWILDDLSPLRQASSHIAEDGPHLFEPRPVVRWIDGSGGRGRGAQGQNPPFGAIIHFALPQIFDKDGETEVKLELLDSSGQVLRSLSSETPEPQAPSAFRRIYPEFFDPPLLDVSPGANRYVWNLRLADADLVDDAVLWGSAGGPTVPPGTYQTRLTVGDWSDTKPISVVPDPRLDASQKVDDARFALAKSIWRQLTRSHDAIKKLRSVRSQVNEATTHLDDEEATKAAEDLVASLTTIEERLSQIKSQSSQDMLNFPPQIDNQLVHLLGIVDSAQAEPTAVSEERFAELKSELDQLISELDESIATTVPTIEEALEVEDVKFIVVEEKSDTH